MELFHLLQKAGIIADSIIQEEQPYNDPHLKERKFFVEVTNPEIGTYATPGSTDKMPKVPFSIRKPPGLL
ncbi:hypothetical protein FIM08_00070 [SAR202 cluster bacterium AC-647-N09_OGT_505m]|nr:hypothetical protein [SAR202 cluster bacterium AC-647-N09_OGT_505m]